MKVKSLFALSILLLSSQHISAQSANHGTCEAQDSIPTVELDAVTVTASTVGNNPTGYSIKIAGKDIAKGKSTMQLLDFLPNVADENGTLKINGLPATEITIDGRILRSLSELESLPADQIESVKVNYLSAAGKINDSVGGSISIKLKKAPRGGYYGTLMAGLNAAPRSGLTSERLYGSFSGRIGAVSIYESLSGRLMDVDEWYTSEVTESDVTDKRDMHTNFRFRNVFNTLGLGWDPAEGHSLGVTWDLTSRWNRTLDCEEDTGSPLMRKKGKSLMNALALNYSGTLGERGGTLKARGEWYRLDSRDTQRLMESGLLYSTPDVHTLADIYEMSVDYSRTFGSSHSANMGVTYRINDIRSEVTDGVSSLAGIGSREVLSRTPEIYAEAQGRFGRVSYYGSLSWRCDDVRLDDDGRYSQSALSPSLQLTFPLDASGRSTLRALYRNVMASVPYDAISEKITWISGSWYMVGNSSLRAPRENYAALMASLLNSRLNLTLSYSGTKNEIEWLTFDDPDNKFVSYTRSVNIDRPYNVYALMADYSRTLFGVWTLKTHVRFALNREVGMMGSRDYNATRFRQFYSVSNSFNFGKGWGASLYAYVEPTFRNFSSTYHTACQINGRIYKGFLDNSLYVILDFDPWGKRRKLGRESDGRKYSTCYSTPVQNLGLTIQFNFKGGRKDIDVNVRGTTVNYDEMRAN